MGKDIKDLNIYLKDQKKKKDNCFLDPGPESIIGIYESPDPDPEIDSYGFLLRIGPECRKVLYVELSKFTINNENMNKI